ncbi:aldehyde dehydrogenase [Nocardioides immobilis]|uniref:Aldehyde dehydrogenase n=1 Tax=Nocardioides immobilis TaxID=2049295 RepID=A0A417Y6P0_9ACTN|nr:aldehyde dehydrogenase [Nocardioides immobilis]
MSLIGRTGPLPNPTAHPTDCGGESVSTTIVEYDLFINGEWVSPVAGRRYPTANPYTGETWAQVGDADDADVDRAVKSARTALSGVWGTMTGFDRAALMRKLAELLRRDAARLAKLESRDSGKLLREMSTQTAYLPSWFDYFGGVADKIQGSTIPSDRPNFLVYTEEVPVGVVAAIVPWNSPLMLLVWKLAPAIAAGCTIVVKPSDQTPVTALELALLFEEAGFPPGVFNVVTGNGPRVGQALSAHPKVDKIAFTGSTATGALVAAAAAKNLTRVSLELGGKSAQIVFEDADVEATVNGIISGVFAATGQTCMAGARLLVHENMHDEVVRRVVARAETIVLGDPTEEATEMGPVNNQTQLAKITSMLEQAKAEGASFACGGPGGDTKGYFVRPTVVTNVSLDSALYREEVFGPVLAVATFTSEDEAVAMANATEFGLAAGIWTVDVRRAHRVARQLRAGTVWINAYRVVAPNVPFGGFGQSGIGRESGVDAVREFTETRATWVELSGATRDPFTIG